MFFFKSAGSYSPFILEQGTLIRTIAYIGSAFDIKRPRVHDGARKR